MTTFKIIKLYQMDIKSAFKMKYLSNNLMTLKRNF